MNEELINHILEKSTDPIDRVERAYALGLHEGITARPAVEERNNATSLKTAIKTIESQERDLTHITKLIYNNNLSEARYFALDSGCYTYNCYTYNCYGDCG